MKTIAKKLTLFCGIGLLVFTLGSCGQFETVDAPKVRIVLVAKDMAFHLENQPEQTNPTIALKCGETVELVLRNDDAKRVLHCFVISGLDVKTPSLDAGESMSLTFRPTERGTLTYACLMHPTMMGKVIVQ